MDPTLNPHEVELREQDRWLPIANVSRLMKNTLPNTAKVSKDAKECMQECVSEFISFLTSEASERCQKKKQKTINGEDILYSMHDLGFENYAEALKIYLAKYREQQAIKQERGETRVSRKHSKSSLQIPVDTGETAVTESPINDDMIQPYENGQEQYESGGDQDQENSEEHTFFYGDREKLKEELEDHQIPLQEVTKHDDYQYHDFISDPNEEPLNENHNIDELTKQLTNEDSEIDTLAGDTNYF